MTDTDRTTLPEAALVALSEWIDKSNVHRDPEAITWGRIAKITEEAGEVIAAYIGATGQNPRKGVIATTDEVIDELLDVAVTALGAVEHMTGHKGRALRMLDEKIVRVWADASAILNDHADVWEQDRSDPCRVRICREFANAFRTYAEGVGVPSIDSLRKKRRAAEEQVRTLTAERDSARDWAVRLEQELAAAEATVVELREAYRDSVGVPATEHQTRRLEAMARRLEAAEATVQRVRGQVQRWDERLDGKMCPSCLAPLAGPFSGCDHEEGYHHALSDMLRALDGDGSPTEEGE